MTDARFPASVLIDFARVLLVSGGVPDTLAQIVAEELDVPAGRVSAPTGRVVATIPVAASPQALAVDGGSVWVVGDAR